MYTNPSLIQSCGFEKGFEMSSAQTDFEIKVKMQNNVDSGAPRNVTSEVDSEQLILSPAEPHKLSENRTVEAELLGDLAGYNEIPSMSNKMLMIPFHSGSDPATALATNQDQWMLIDKTEISLDGRECDRVGTSFTAFRYQSGACQKPVGSCLSNQLLDRYEKDLNRTRDGLTPLHLLGRYTGQPAIGKAPSTAGSGALILQFPITQIRNSIVTLSVQADSLRFVINASPGEILSAQVCKFANVTCGGFEALTDVGYLTVEVKNTGYIQADYTATVSNCSVGVIDMGAQKVALQAGQSEQLPSFLVRMSSDAQQDDLFCWVGLRDSLGELTDTKEVNFYVNQTAYNQKTLQPDSKDGNGVGDAPKDLDCTDYCPNILDVPCFLVKRCWSRLLLLFGLILLVLATGSLCLTAIRRGWCVKIFVCWGKLVFSKGSKKKKSKGSSKKKKRNLRESIAVKMMSKMMEESFGSKGDIDRVHTAESHGLVMQAMNPLSTSVQSSQQAVASTTPTTGNEMVYLALTPLGTPPWLFSPGPFCCLIGKLQVVQSMPGLPPDYIFTVPEHHALQRVAFNAETGNYQRLPQPMSFDPDMVTLVLDEKTVHQMISTSPRGACLN
ncbi:hypothetical protein BSKO_11635 [Bryopsis sp. KO-2023]|nr:hypothetical protein BSKO_11635 [Bryopsis sp. KO-2023]